jgi:hypothetical protein
MPAPYYCSGSIHYVYDGGDLYELDLTDEQLALACDIQCWWAI